MIRVAERHDAARGDDGDGGLADGGDSRAGLNAVEHRHGVFGAERFAVEFLDEHLHSAFRAGLFIEHVLADALGEDAGRFRIGDLLALEPKKRNAFMKCSPFVRQCGIIEVYQ